MNVVFIILLLQLAHAERSLKVLMPSWMHSNDLLSEDKSQLTQSNSSGEIITGSNQSWVRDYILFDTISELIRFDSSSKDHPNDAYNNQDIDPKAGYILLDKKKFTNFLLKNGFKEDELEFLNNDLDYGYDEIEKELEKVKRDKRKKPKLIDIGGEDGQESSGNKVTTCLPKNYLLTLMLFIVLTFLGFELQF